MKDIKLTGNQIRILRYLVSREIRFHTYFQYDPAAKADLNKLEDKLAKELKNESNTDRA
jgi:hypothetical protein